MLLVVALIVTLVLLVTEKVLIVNVAVWLPDGIVMLAAGLAIAGLLLESITVILPGAAGHSSVTVPDMFFPPLTDVEPREIDLTPIGRTVKVAFWSTPSKAVIWPVIGAVTATVLMVKEALLFPAPIFIMAGTIA